MQGEERADAMTATPGVTEWIPDDISHSQTEYATSLRVPLLSTFNPRWYYITGIVVREDSRFPNSGLMPTEEEVGLVADRLQTYCKRWYRESFLQRMRAFAPFDIDGSANLAYFLKRDDGGWAYRKRTWDHGPLWLPLWDAPAESLTDVIARTER